ncbi:hypothetical protein [Uliginosibacterium gangwonense]|uniref:hypothetical protein n=1 Tax=Uliginosibacterium gangwonense TaxID=392736 RepID=UPI00036741B4|nr:hypothetical protein [Uliginosibacterium gangwonense]
MNSPQPVHDIFVGGELRCQFLESIWYDTASPAQACIACLRALRDELPRIEIVSFGTRYKIETLADFKEWASKIFSPTHSSYQCDFSEYL